MGSTEEGDSGVIRERDILVTRSHYMPIRLDVSDRPFDLFAYVRESCFETANVRWRPSSKIQFLSNASHA